LLPVRLWFFSRPFGTLHRWFAFPRTDVLGYFLAVPSGLFSGLFIDGWVSQRCVLGYSLAVASGLFIDGWVSQRCVLGYSLAVASGLFIDGLVSQRCVLG
jgi:hypothetical protein